MKKYDRVFLLVIDSLGIGQDDTSKEYGDVDVDTLLHISESVDSLKIPNLQRLGLANLHPIKHVDKVEHPLGYQMKLREASVGKDTMTGHWEMMGLHITKPFKTFTDTGFPQELLDELSERTGHKIVGNKSASGTAILDELGEHQMKTGDMIVYTSADSVFQIAAHEDIIPLEELYDMCKIAREIMMGEYAVARVIARPYVGPCKGQFERTSNRRDYSLNPFDKTVLDNIKENGLDVIAVGKIEDIFNGQGITEAIHTKDNMDGVDQTINYIKKDNKGLIFTNLVDFDSKYGHRRNIKGYKEALEEFDARIPEIIESMNEKDILIINADHGNDPAYKGTDHTREYIPLLVYGKDIKEGINLGTRKSFADIGATVADILNVSKTKNGTSFKEEVMK